MKRPIMRMQFERAYAKRSGISIEQLHAAGLHAEACGCGEALCQGWRMNWEDRRERASEFAEAFAAFLGKPELAAGIDRGIEDSSPKVEQ